MKSSREKRRVPPSRLAQKPPWSQTNLLSSRLALHKGYSPRGKRGTMRETKEKNRRGNEETYQGCVRQRKEKKKGVLFPKGAPTLLVKRNHGGVQHGRDSLGVESLWGAPKKRGSKVPGISSKKKERKDPRGPDGQSRLP